jgi:predicted DNA binding CopG/RHH family protein
MKKLKPFPVLKSDEEAEDFVANADLTQFDFSEFKRVHFELQPKTERVNMRLPKTLLDAARAKAAKEGIPYQRLIRRALERELSLEAAESQPSLRAERSNPGP